MEGLLLTGLAIYIVYLPVFLLSLVLTIRKYRGFSVFNCWISNLGESKSENHLSFVVSLILLEKPQISFIKYTDQEGLEVRASGPLTIFLSHTKSLEWQLEDLQTIVQKYKIEGKDLKQVDLRYDQPVIKY